MLAPLALVAFAAVARAEISAGDVNGIKERFTNAELDPLFSPSNFSTEGLIQAKWSSGATLAVGNPLDPKDAAQFPWGDNSTTFNVNPVANSSNFNSSELYTAILFDAAQVGTNLTGGANQKLHWLINNLHLQTNVTGGPYPFLYDNATTVKQYQGPNPPTGDAPHRYVVLLYKQPANFTPPAEYKTQDQVAQVSDFDFHKYVSDAKLTDVVGSTFFTVVQPGQTQSVAPTKTATSNITAQTDGSSSGSGNSSSNANGEGGNGTNTAGSATQSGPSGSAKPSSGDKTFPVVGFTLMVAAAVAALL